MGSSGDNREKINCQYEINMLDWCLFLFVVVVCILFLFFFIFYQKIQRQKPAKQISNSNFKNSGISGRKINSTLGQPYFLSKDQFCVQIALSCVCLVN